MNLIRAKDLYRIDVLVAIGGVAPQRHRTIDRRQR